MVTTQRLKQASLEWENHSVWLQWWIQHLKTPSQSEYPISQHLWQKLLISDHLPPSGLLTSCLPVSAFALLVHLQLSSQREADNLPLLLLAFHEYYLLSKMKGKVLQDLCEPALSTTSSAPKHPWPTQPSQASHSIPDHLQLRQAHTSMAALHLAVPSSWSFSATSVHHICSLTPSLVWSANINWVQMTC